MDPKAWPRYFRIASFVQRLELKIYGETHLPKYDRVAYNKEGIFPKDLSAALQLATSFRSPLFPSLRSIDCEMDSLKSSSHLVHILPTTLEEIRLSLVSFPSYVGTAIRSLQFCSRLRSFVCEDLGQTTPKETARIADVICEVLPHLPLLEVVELESVYLRNQAVWKTLSGLPSLSELRLSSSKGPLHVVQPALSTLHIENGFPSLNIVGVPLSSEHVGDFLNHSSECPPSLLLNITGKTESLDVAGLLSAKWKTLTSLTLVFPESHFLWGAGEMENLFGLSCLTHLDIQTISVSLLDDDDFESIAKAFPLIEKLSISAEPLDTMEAPKMTFESLFSLAEHCPKIREIGVCIDTDGSFNAPVPEHPSFSKLESLHFGLSDASSDPWFLSLVRLAITHLVGSDVDITGGIRRGIPNGRGLTGEMEKRASECSRFWWEIMEHNSLFREYNDVLVKERDQARERLKEIEERYEILLGESDEDSL